MRGAGAAAHHEVIAVVIPWIPALAVAVAVACEGARATVRAAIKRREPRG